MSWFTAARKVTDPEGRSWEIYAFRTKVPAWRAADSAAADDTWESPVGAILFLPWLLLQAPLFLVQRVVIPAARFLVALPRAATQREATWTVEAVTFLPAEERYSWATSADHRRRVADQVAAGLERGELARPLGAKFNGAQR